MPTPPIPVRPAALPAPVRLEAVVVRTPRATANKPLPPRLRELIDDGIIG